MFHYRRVDGMRNQPGAMVELGIGFSPQWFCSQRIAGGFFLDGTHNLFPGEFLLWDVSGGRGRRGGHRQDRRMAIQGNGLSGWNGWGSAIHRWDFQSTVLPIFPKAVIGPALPTAAAGRSGERP